MRKSQVYSPAKSPKKNRPSTANQNSMPQDQNGDGYYTQGELHQAQMTISEQEIEIERLKTTVIALNSKCSIVDDHKIDVDSHYTNHTESESKRVELHEHITTTSTKIHYDNEAHTDYQSELQSNISDLNAKLESEKQR